MLFIHCERVFQSQAWAHLIATTRASLALDVPAESPDATAHDKETHASLIRHVNLLRALLLLVGSIVQMLARCHLYSGPVICDLYGEFFVRFVMNWSVFTCGRSRVWHSLTCLRAAL